MLLTILAIKVTNQFSASFFLIPTKIIRELKDFPKLEDLLKIYNGYWKGVLDKNVINILNNKCRKYMWQIYAYKVPQSLNYHLMRKKFKWLEGSTSKAAINFPESVAFPFFKHFHNVSCYNLNLISAITFSIVTF